MRKNGGFFDVLEITNKALGRQGAVPFNSEITIEYSKIVKGEEMGREDLYNALAELKRANAITSGTAFPAIPMVESEEPEDRAPTP